MNDMLNTDHVDDFIVTEDNGVETVSIGHLGQRRLREDFFAQTDINFDLNEGYERWSDKDRSAKRLCLLFDYMIQKSPEGDLMKALNGAKFVTRRGVLTHMAVGKNVIIHRGHGNWQVVCERRKGVIFMEQEMLPKEIEESKNQNKLSCFWGYRFEEYMVDGFRSDSTAPQELRMVMTATLENEDRPIKVMYSGEVDAMDSDGQYVEMKTLKNCEPRFNYWFRHHRSVSWWLQSRFVDVPYLVIGLRNDEGHVQKLEKMTLDEISTKQAWNCNGKKCLRFLRDTLVTIEETLKEGEAMRVNCTGGKLTMSKIRPEEAGILTQKFIDHFKL